MTLDCGIDAGGTRSAWLVRDDGGREIARGVGGPIQAAGSAPDAVAAALRALVADAEREVGAPVTALVAGLAGAGSTEVRRAILTSLAPGMPCAIVGDPELAAAAALAAAPGVAVWSGTGSFAVARGVAGRLQRVGGRGWLLSDRGSAYAIVRRAAVAASDAFDDLGPTTALGTALVEAAGAPSLARLGATLQTRAPRELAALLPCVAMTAERGDPVARQVFDEAATALLRLAAAAARRAELPPATPLWVGGGALTGCRPLLSAFRRVAAEAAGNPVENAPEAVLGAARLAAALRTRTQPMIRWIDDRTP